MASATGEKAPDAFKTIGELSDELGVAQHILRYWETRFPQLKPLQRAGNRRYYRPADVELARRINQLLNEQGYTVRGVQKLLREKRGNGAEDARNAAPAAAHAEAPKRTGAIDVQQLARLRNRLAAALED